MTHDVFISYSTKNKQTADAICHVLEENNLKCWIAPRNIHSGNNYAEEIVNGIKTTKIVVLVFSQDSQESPFVNNEVDIAFSNNKPIISFKIDQSMPKDKLEYFLKNKHWLEAYPEPEKVFETLVRDALLLCEKEQRYITITEQETSNSLSQNLGISRDSDLISFILLITPLHSLSFIYMGIMAKKKKWILYGVLYLIPLALIIYVMFSGLSYLSVSKFVPLLRYFILIWILAIIHGIVIRKEFLSRKTVLNMMSIDDELFDELVEEYTRV